MLKNGHNIRNTGRTRFKKGQKPWNLGLKMSDDFKLKCVNRSRGKYTKEKHPGWIKDRSKLQTNTDTFRDRSSSMYNYWTKQVKNRDNYKCKINNEDCNGRLEAHHMLSWIDYPELRYDINNGVTLCHDHHPRKRSEEKRLIPTFQELVSVSK